MRLRRGPREVCRVYGEDEAPDVDEWSDGEAPTSELDVPSDEPAPVPRPKPHARLGKARRVAATTLLGLGVGLVAALAIHSLRAPAGVDGRKAGKAGQGAAAWPSTSLTVPVAAAPLEAHTQRTMQAVQVKAVPAPRGHSKKRESPMRRAVSAAYTAVYRAAATSGQGTAEAQPSAEAAQSEFTFER